MVKALIVDDEEWIRLGLREQVEWNSLGIEIIGEAQNGAVAIEIIEEKQPEIVVTDIRMPKMDGITLMEYINKKYPSILIIVISGYSEFEYAKKAISFSAFDYILKPIEEEVLQKTLIKAVEKVKQDNIKKDILINMKIKLNESSGIIRDKIFTDLILKSDISFEEMERSIQRVGLSFSWLKMVVLIFKAANFHNVVSSEYNGDTNLAGFALSNVIGELVESNADSILFRNYVKNDEIILIKGFGTDEYNIIIEDIYSTCERIIDSVRKYIGFEIYIGIGGEFTSLKDAGKSYSQAVEAVHNAGMMDEDRVIHYNEISSRCDCFIYPDDKEKALLYYIENNYKSQTDDLIEKLFKEIEENRAASPNSIKSTMLELTISINKLLKKYSYMIEEQMNDWNIGDIIINELFTVGKLKEWFKAVSIKAMNLIKERKRAETKKTIDHIVDYLNKHYSEDINLNSVSVQFYINFAYLSRMFKNEIGQNFNDYITKIRMEAAVKLLKHDELKMSNISEMIGFEDVNYFLKKFKKYFNCTPTEYRKKFV